ncbi:UDP-glycosyltransferase 708G1-like [Impatiens glandulifera]|uniref:UDP-glycosyltransferase 708G1-like n=1 Tax=Impatiens glandulifera TaxID=253017 RepID=UPI001FB050A0|nr:UDP-glycosyltransferase 708G1-like [Impatiens glandulifera]
MSNSTSQDHHISSESPHIVLFPSPGMGHLTPFLRLAVIFASQGCLVTLIKPQPSLVSDEESKQISNFLNSHYNINSLEFHPTVLNSENSISNLHDSFINQVKALNSLILCQLPSFLLSLPKPATALFADFAVAASLETVSSDISIPCFLVCTTSARCYSTVAYLPELISKISKNPSEFEIPGISPVPRSIIPPSWLDISYSNELLTTYLIPNALSLSKVSGILLNSFTSFEKETITSLMEGKVLTSLPPMYPIGPLHPYELDQIQEHDYFSWLGDKPAESVVYVNFGSRTVLSDEQTRELEQALKRSGFPFIWVFPESSFDDSFVERKDVEGFVLKGWANQPGILSHPSVGGFINQCEWDSVTEASKEGVPILAWPQHGDHKMNAEVVKNAGLGIWVEDWGWGGEKLVKSNEIEARVRELMGDKSLRAKSKKVAKEAKKAWEGNGSSKQALHGVLELLIQKKKNLK